MQTEDIDTAWTKAVGNAVQVAARRPLLQQVVKRIESAVGGIDWPSETKIGHFGDEYLGLEPALREPPSNVVQ
jgi:hypothetical protein